MLIFHEQPAGCIFHDWLLRWQRQLTMPSKMQPLVVCEKHSYSSRQSLLNQLDAGWLTRTQTAVNRHSERSVTSVDVYYVRRSQWTYLQYRLQTWAAMSQRTETWWVETETLRRAWTAPGRRPASEHLTKHSTQHPLNIHLHCVVLSTQHPITNHQSPSIYHWLHCVVTIINWFFCRMTATAWRKALHSWHTNELLLQLSEKPDVSFPWKVW